jgi:serine/threonine-protein kinase
MITARGLKIVDFGLAQDARSSRITKTHELVGTLDYLAPERIQGVVSDPRSDQYSAGVILYEMLTGKTPYQGASSTAEALLWRLTREPAPIAEYRPDLPAAVQALIGKMIERDPETRFASIDEALETLRTLEKSGLIRT